MGIPHNAARRVVRGGFEALVDELRAQVRHGRLPDPDYLRVKFAAFFEMALGGWATLAESSPQEALERRRMGEVSFALALALLLHEALSQALFRPVQPFVAVAHQIEAESDMVPMQLLLAGARRQDKSLRGFLPYFSDERLFTLQERSAREMGYYVGRAALVLATYRTAVPDQLGAYWMEQLAEPAGSEDILDGIRSVDGRALAAAVGCSLQEAEAIRERFLVRWPWRRGEVPERRPPVQPDLGRYEHELHVGFRESAAFFAPLIQWQPGEALDEVTGLEVEPDEVFQPDFGAMEAVARRHAGHLARAVQARLISWFLSALADGSPQSAGTADLTDDVLIHWLNFAQKAGMDPRMVLSSAPRRPTSAELPVPVFDVAGLATKRVTLLIGEALLKQITVGLPEVMDVVPVRAESAALYWSLRLRSELRRRLESTRPPAGLVLLHQGSIDWPLHARKKR